MLAVARRPITSHEPSLMSTSSLGTRWARNHCCPALSAIGSATKTQRENELLEPQAKSPETRKPPSVSTDFALGNKVAQQATGPLPKISHRALGSAPPWTKVLTPFEISMHQPAEPSARAISSVASNRSTPLPPSPPSSSGSRIENRLACSSAAATLSGRRPSRSDASASVLTSVLIAFARSSGHAPSSTGESLTTTGSLSIRLSIIRLLFRGYAAVLLFMSGRRHRQLGICRLTEGAMGCAMPGDARDYTAMAARVTAAQVAKVWVRPDRRFAAVSWSRRRGKTLAIWSWAERKR